jgi:hypothetical protein
MSANHIVVKIFPSDDYPNAAGCDLRRGAQKWNAEGIAGASDAPAK